MPPCHSTRGRKTCLGERSEGSSAHDRRRGIEDALFWANLHGIKDVEFKTVREWLANGGYAPPAHPADDRVSAELTTLLDRLADLGVVIEFADHLTDRELYSWLLASGHLEAHIALLPDSFVHIDVTGSGYYASDENRASWKEQFPDDELPPRKPLPHNHDGSGPAAAMLGCRHARRVDQRPYAVPSRSRVTRH